MLEELPRHAGYVIASYAVVVAVIGGLIVWIVQSRREQARMLATLEQGRAEKLHPLEGESDE